MPRLPMIRVIGSHDIATRFLSAIRSAFRCGARLSPGGLAVERRFREVAQRAHSPAVHEDGRSGHLRARWLVHEGHELVGEPWHGAADAHAADVRTAADAVHPAALGHVAEDHRAPAAELHDALARAVVGREIALLVVATSIAAFVNC